MKYTPKNIDENFNVSKNKPLADFLLLLSGAILGLLGIYFILGLLVNFMIPRLPDSFEKKISNGYSKFIDFEHSDSNSEKAVQSLLNSLQEKSDPIKYSIYIKPDNQVNAFAVPGNSIVLFSKLIEKTESENELAFIIGHEIGHFKNKDHLKGLGRGLVLLFISTLFFDGNNYVNDFLSKQLSNIHVKFSQNQETMADIYALKLLNQKYGHIGGSTGFFEKIAKDNKKTKLQYYFATHPHPENRIKRIYQEAKLKGYEIKPSLPLSDNYRDFK